MCNAERFNRRASSAKSKPDQILKALDLKSGQRVADIGAGGGYFTLRFAESVGTEGEVCAVDTDEENLAFIRRSAVAKKLNIIKLVRIAGDKIDLPNDFFDLIFFRNVYHHLENRVELMKAYQRKLKKDGRLAIIEYRPGGSIFSFHRLFGHHVPKEKIIYEMEKADFKKIEDFDFLPEQSFTIFQKNEL